MNEDEYGLIRMGELLQELHASVDGVVSAPTLYSDYPTGEINSVDLPMVIAVPSDGGWDMWDMSAQDTQIRKFDVKLFTATHDQGLDGEALETTIRIMQRLGQAYTRRSAQQLQSSPSQILINVQDAPVTDTGVTALVTWQDNAYWGCEFLVTLYEKYTIGESG